LDVIRLLLSDGITDMRAPKTIRLAARSAPLTPLVPLRHRNGNQYLHRQSARYRDQVKRKVGAYHVFIQAGVIAQGLLQYLSVVAPKLVWDSFGSWLRTIRPGIPPSELVVAQALRQTLPDFLLVSSNVCVLAKFIADRQNTHNMTIFRLTA
jgi:hypothetical protein